MSRDRSPALVAADTARHRGWMLLLEVLFDGGTLRLCMGPNDVVAGGETFTATGALLSIDEQVESADGTEGLTFSLSGCAPGIVDLVASEPYKGRPLRLMELRLDAEHQPVGEPVVEYIGRMVSMTSTEEPVERSHTVVVQTEHFDAQARRPTYIRFSDAEQRRRFPDDKGAEFVTSLTERVLAPTKK